MLVSLRIFFFFFNTRVPIQGTSDVFLFRFIGDFEYSALTMNLHPSERMVSSRVKGSPTIQSQEGTKQCTGVLEPGDEPRE